MKEKPIYKNWLAWVIVAIIIGAIAFYDSDDSEKATTEPKKEVVKKEKPEVKPKATLNDKIKKAADPHFGKITKFEVNEDMGKNDGGKIILIHVKQDGVTKNTADYNTRNALEKVFKNDKVNEITYFWDATLVDVKGNESVDTVLKIQMSKDTAKTINWENFSHKNLNQVADQYNISPVLQ